MKILPNCQQFNTYGKYNVCKNKILNKIKQESYFFNSNLEVISKHFLNSYFKFNIWQESFHEILNSYQLKFNDMDMPVTEKDFYKYIANEYLELEKNPKDELFKLYMRVNEDLVQIKKTILKLSDELEQIQSQKEENGYLEVEPRYRIKHIEYYIEKNKQAKKRIIDFLCKDIKELAHENSQVKKHSFGLTEHLFFGRKSYPYYHSNSSGILPIIKNIYDINEFSNLDNKMLELSFDGHTKVSNLLKKGKHKKVLRYLNEYMEHYNLLNQIKAYTKTNHIINARKPIIKRILKHLKNKDYISVNNILPLQIEGLFHDFCLLIGVKEKELNISSLNAKLDKLEAYKDTHISYFSYEYFSFRFPIIRNKVAHGRYFDANDQFQAIYLIYDLYSVCEMICNEKIELNSIIQQIQKINIEEHDFQNKFDLIKNINQELPPFYIKEIKKRDKIKQQYIQDKFLIDFKEYIHKSNDLDELDYIVKNIGWIKLSCLEKGSKEIDYLFKEVNQRKKQLDDNQLKSREKLLKAIDMTKQLTNS